jgi:DNA-binding SARP family transcriptional activator
MVALVLRVHVLGELALESAGRPIAPPASRRARSLLAWLALHPGEHPRTDLAGRFWPDVLESSARTSLRGALAELRRCLGDEAGALVATRDRVGLARDGRVWIDAAAFDAYAAGDQLDEALALLRGELLADLSDDWVHPLRDARRHDVMAVLERAAGEAEARGDFARAIALTRRATALDPLGEEVHRSLMRRLAGSGDRAAAIAVGRALADRLRRDLGIAPAPETRALAASLAAAAPEPEPAPAPAAAPLAPGPAEGALPFPSALGAPRAPLVGRDDELAALRRARDEAMAGETRLFLLAGDAGIGKTALARAAAHEAVGEGGTILYGRCDEDGIGAYEPWVQVAGHVVHHASPALLGALASDVGAELARLAPELRRRVPSLPAPVQAEPDTERWRLFDALASTLALLADEAPVTVVLDDLHWADRSTLLVLRHLVRRRPDARLLVIGTYRAVELDDDAPLAAALADLRREHLFAELTLEGLAREDVATLVAHRDRDRAADPAFVADLHDRTEGNPFFVEEVLRSAGADGVPQGVREAVNRRLARLDADVVELLSVAAVAGRAFDLDLLARLHAGADAGHDALVARLEAAVAAQAIDEVGVGRYAFAHALIRATLYDALSLTRRARLHLQIGQALEQGGGASYGQLAHHFWVAAAGELARVVDYSDCAAREALGQLAYDEAADHARRALRALDAVETPDPARRAALLLVLGEALSRTGDRTGARQAFADAAAAARAHADAAALGRAALGFAGPTWETFGEVDDAAISLLEDALLEQPAEHVAMRALLQARLAAALYFTSAPERVRALADEAHALARTSADPFAAAGALEAKLYASWHPDGLDERLAVAGELVALADAQARPELGAVARRWRIAALMEAGRHDEARAETARHAEIAAALRHPYELMYVSVFGATWARLDGDHATAQRLIEEVAATGEVRGGADALQFVGVHLLSHAQVHGGLEHLVTPLRANAIRYASVPGWRCSVAYALVAAGRPDEARAELAALAPLPRRLPRDANWLPALAFAALTCEGLGDPALAAELRAALEPYADRSVVLGAGGAIWGRIEDYISLLDGVLQAPPASASVPSPT